MRPGLAWMCAVLSVIAFAIGPTGAAARDDDGSPGLDVGQVAPMFTLPDQHGTPVSLTSLLERGPVAIVFHRSVDWCLYCKLQMVQLQRILGEVENAGGQVVAISFDAVGKLDAFATRTGITFPLLADVDSRVIDAYDIRHKEAPPESSGFARHATFIVGQNGIIRAKLFQLSFQERPAIESLLDALKAAAMSPGDTHK